MKKKINVLITAGPTREYIDAVRFISNSSSGKMGYYLTNTIKKDANVILISGPTYLKPPQDIKIIYVETTEEMYKYVKKFIKSCDVFICCAAIGDFKLKNKFKHKIKKKKTLILNLISTIDILKNINEYLIKMKLRNKKILVGFALETHNILKNALNKLKQKNLELIIANRTNTIGTEFIKGIMIDYNNKKEYFNNISKKRASKKIWNKIKNICMQKLFFQLH